MAKRQTVRTDAQWHLDKKVPIALIGALVIQTAGMSWWAATIQTRVASLEDRALIAAPQAERLTRVEEKLGSLQSVVGDIQKDVKALLRKN